LKPTAEERDRKKGRERKGGEGARKILRRGRDVTKHGAACRY